MQQLPLLPIVCAVAVVLADPPAVWAQPSPDPGLLLKRVTSGPVTTVSQAAHMAAWGDYDGDGRLDLFVLNYLEPSRLFHNDGEGNLALVADAAVSAVTTPNTLACSWGDYDNDGRLDLVIARPSDTPLLWHNNGDGTFAPSSGSGLTPTGAESYSTAWADYDNDGFLDLTVINAYTPNVLFHSNGDGTFTRVTTGPVVTDALPSVGVAWGDHDNDGALDLFVTTGGGGANLLYHNEGAGRFTRVTQGAIVTDPGYTTGATWGDYDNDGYLDLFVTRRMGNNLLYHNNRDGTFTRVTEGSLVNDGGESNSAGWADFDNDGFLDLFVANWQGGVNFLYRNNGDGTFTRITTGDVANDPPGESVATAWGDYTGDGFVDLFVTRLTGPGYLYRNTDNGNQWLKVRIVGTVSSRNGAGAKVRVKTVVEGVERWQMRQISGAQGWTDTTLEALFGLGTASSVATLRVEWPSGAITELHDVTTKQTLTLQEQPPLLTMRPKAGFFTNSVEITLATPLADREIRYTLDNTEPTAGALLYTRAFTLQETATVQARVFTNGQPASAILSNVYTRKIVPPSVVAPDRYATVPGEGWSSVFNAPIRIQHLYGAAYFPASPILITEIRLRPWAGQPAGSGTVPDLAVWLSTTAKAADHLSTTFAENVGADETVVFDGPLTVNTQGASAGTQGEFDFLIPLAQPFLYDPSQGNLLVDFRNRVAVSLPELDATSASDDLASRVWNHGDPNAATATMADTGANILQFIYAERIPALLIIPSGGSTDRPVWVRLFSSVKNGLVRYTLDGSEPTVTSSAYTGSFKLIQNTTVKARTFVEDTPASDIVSAAYQITLTPPSITSTLKDQTATEGTSPSYTAEAAGSAPLSYQWRFEGQEIADATNATLRLSNVQLAQAGTYSLRVTNDAGAVVRDLWVLKVNPKPQPPTIVVGPQPMMALVGSTVTFTAAVTGTEPLTYEWRDRLNRVVGRAPTLTLTNVQPSQAGNYLLRVYNVAGSRTSAPAELKVVNQPVAPTVARQPAGQAVLAGSTAILSVAIQGTEPLVYEWRRNGQPLSGAAAGPVLRLTEVQASQAGTYTVLVTNLLGAVLSSGAVLEVGTQNPGGTVHFANRGTTFDAPVWDEDGTTRLAGAAFLAQLYAGPTAQELAPVGAAVPFGSDLLAGYVQPFDPVRVVTTVAPGAPAFAQVRAWETSAGPTFEDALQAGGKTGQSTVLPLLTGGGAPPSAPAELAGLVSFAVAREQVPPDVVITAPVPGTTGDERFALSGTVTDNVGTATVRWEWDGQPMGPLPLAEGRFLLAGLRLHPGDNLLRVVATDRAGNAGAASVTARWEPLRSLELADAGTTQEGRHAALDLRLASAGEVTGLGFVIAYDPVWFQDPEFTWAETLASGIRQVNFDTVGEVRATLAVSGPLPAGVVTLGQLSLRARSVPAPTSSILPVQVTDVSDALGNRLSFGTATQAGKAVIQPRRIVGDNNANDRLDIGDATAIQRYLVHLAQPRAWDIPANDLNGSLDLDSGDAVKALRAAVGLDPQPVPPGTVGLASASPPAAGTAGTAVLSADRWRASAGEFITIQVRLQGLGRPIAGASFRLAYPPQALRFVDANSLRAGPMVPPSALTLWNVTTSFAAQEGTVRCASSSAAVWTAPNGLLAELTFQVQAGVTGQTWPLQLGQVEVTSADGLDLQPLTAATLELNPLVLIQPQLQFGPDGFRLTFSGVSGLEYTIEASSDFANWTSLGTRLNPDGVVTFTDPAALGLPARFYRVREGR